MSLHVALSARDLARNCPEADRQEMEGFFDGIERGNQRLGDDVAFSLEWLNSEEITLAWRGRLAHPLAAPLYAFDTPAGVRFLG